MKAILDKEFEGDASDIDRLTQEDIFSESTLDLVKKHSPKFYKTLIKNGFETVLVAHIKKDDDVCAYLVCAVKRSLRIWQENECAILYFLAELLADEF